MKDFEDLIDHVPLDQAEGLRRMFARQQRRYLALVSNPHVRHSGVAVERLTAALSLLGLRSLVVDAGETSPSAPEAAALDLAACVERLTSRISYLPGRGLSRRYVDTHGSSASLLEEFKRVAPRVDVVVLHAPAPELARLFTQRAARPVLLANDHPESVKHAYASLKLLAQRSGWMSFDLLLLAQGQPARHARIADSVSSCAEQFISAALHDWATLDPKAPATEPPSPELMRLVVAQLELDDTAPPAALSRSTGGAPLALAQRRN
jgi:flagellar biosynthesis protein FlhG